MRTPVRLALYGSALVALFVISFAAAGALVPDEAADDWTEPVHGSAGTDEDAHQESSAGSGGADDGSSGDGRAEAGGEHGGADPHDDGEDGHGGTHDDAAPGAEGLTIEQDGYRLDGVAAPGRPGAPGSLSLSVLGPDGEPVTGYESPDGKELHLITVRTDGAGFQHVHPERDADGRWSVPWEWEHAGTYRVYADFVPAATGEQITLTQTVDVAGELVPGPERTTSDTAAAGEFEVTVEGTLTPGAPSALTFTVSRDGTPVTTLEPYLRAYGHLVALRRGDLAYLHVHPTDEPSDPHARSGPGIEFTVEAPTPGTYLLYLSFQVDGAVHTAEFTLTAG